MNNSGASPFWRLVQYPSGAAPGHLRWGHSLRRVSGAGVRNSAEERPVKDPEDHRQRDPAAQGDR
jgi:hypothetical protein